MPLVSIVIVSWNVKALLANCLASIYETTAGLAVEIIVVDSNSGDGTVELIGRDFPHVKLLALADNVGFSRGNNLGIGISTGEYIFLLNPDTLVKPETIQQLAAYLNDHPEVGIVGPRTLNGDGTTQSTRRRFPTLLTGLFESTWLQSIAPKAIMRCYYVQDQPDDGTFEVDWVQGSALMFRREVFAQIGGMDEGFMMYSEELDWCKRAVLAGWRVDYVGGARIVHFGGKSSEQAPALTHIRFQCSKLRYFRKYHGRAEAELLRFALLTNYASQYMIEGSKRLVGHKPALRAERMQVYATVLRSGLKVS
ncbi:MAG: glycosyltransferase family 2 protein [Anaerolineae bacterium]|nr:glycosyltransferase family 2 protein [Anaerolineae bacterium]